jgi:uncharacterized membrane protein YdbT with pleckstrin-like domain
MAAQLNTSRGILTIRRAEVEDAARLRELRLEALVDTPEAFAADLDASAAEPVEWWIERIEEYNRENSSVICLAESGDKLVGMTGLGRGHWRRPVTAALFGVCMSTQTGVVTVSLKL